MLRIFNDQFTKAWIMTSRKCGSFNLIFVMRVRLVWWFIWNRVYFFVSFFLCDRFQLGSIKNETTPKKKEKKQWWVTHREKMKCWLVSMKMLMALLSPSTFYMNKLYVCLWLWIWWTFEMKLMWVLICNKNQCVMWQIKTKNVKIKINKLE